MQQLQSVEKARSRIKKIGKTKYSNNTIKINEQYKMQKCQFTNINTHNHLTITISKQSERDNIYILTEVYMRLRFLFPTVHTLIINH